MKVLLAMPHVVEDLEKYGIAAAGYRHHIGYEHRYARLLRAAGISVSLSILSRRSKEVCTERHDYGHDIIYLPVGGTRYLRMLGSVGSLGRIAGEFDLVHSTSYYSNLHDSLTLASLLTGTPIVAQSQGIYPDMPKSLYIRKLLTLRRSKYLLTLNRTEALLLSSKFRIDARRVVVIPNFIDPRERRMSNRMEARDRLGISDDEFLLLVVSRLERAKGIHVLLNAVSAIGARSRPHIIILGEGPYRGELERLSISLGIADRVRFIGYVDNRDIDPYYAAADAFVLPSLEESFGIVMLEAMFHGVPVIASNAWGPRDIIRDGLNGLLFERGDSAGLAMALMKLISDRNLASEIGERGRKDCMDKYTPEAVIPKIIEVYARATGD
ncbi:MAG: glycosyltransferase family 4 protein [Nitrososphaerota archaeon]|jgi:glycosyltransferase involved in cell wall biosynthesis|nr:glycosyltransferase family 4 protein [Nitrososphaerota archaeon]MDG7038120.1 glycosyltransferase family 4 protein [Nitrososphaerota archaeon]